MPNIQLKSIFGNNPLYPRVKTSNVINDAGFIAVSDSGSSGGVLVNTPQGPKWKNLYAADGYIVVTSVSNDKISLSGNNIPVGVETSLGNYYPIQKNFLTINSDSIEIDISPYLAYDNVSSFTSPWKVWFSGAHLSQNSGGGSTPAASEGQEIITLGTPTQGNGFDITPQNNKVYICDFSLFHGPALDGYPNRIYSNNFTSSYQISFQVHAKQPSTAKQSSFFVYPQVPLLWGDGTGFSSSNSMPAIDTANTLYCFVFRWDGTRLLGNLAYTIDLS